MQRTPPEAAPVAAPAIPFFSQADSFEQNWSEISRHVTDVLDDGKFSHGAKVGELEGRLAAWTGARHVVAVNSGTDALILLLRAAGLRPGDEVIVPAYSFIATASAVALAGGVPVFADIEADGHGADPGSVAAAVTPRTKMIMPVHLFDRMADLRGLRDVARRHGLTIVEDSAEAIGMRMDGAHAGLLGAGGVLSFFPAKTLGGIGDGGAVLTGDAAVAAKVRMLCHHGRGGSTLGDFAGISNTTVLPGRNSKMDDVQAAVLLAKLATLDAGIARRAELAARYDARLHGVPGVLSVPGTRPPPHGSNRVVYVYLLQVDDRDALAAHLRARGIGTEVFYPVPLHLQPCFAHLGHRPGDFPRAEAACATAIALPLYPDLPDAHADRVCDEIEGFYTGRTR